MKKKLTLYRKFILINIIIIIISVLFGSIISKQIIHTILTEKKIWRFPRIIAQKLLTTDFSTTNPKSEIIRDIAEDPSFPAYLWIIDNNKNLLYSNTSNSTPNITLNLTTIPEEKLQKLNNNINILKLSTIKNRFILFKPNLHFGIRFHLIGLGIMILSMILGMSIFSIIVFHFFRKNAIVADNIMNELKKGNLKARLPSRRLDELGLVMTHFNSMADEIERLVDELKKADQARVTLLQELAHDLRTPVSSMKTMLETIVDHWDRKDSLPPTTLKEFTRLTLNEANYFARLVEDLLFLARVSEPKYHKETKNVHISQLLAHEIEIMESQWPQINFEVIGAEFTMLGDAHLLGRLFRNALQNAASYAQKTVKINLRESSVTITDDGPGFNEHSLKNFGIKKFSREINPKTERLSVGLGSVIMKRITEIHHGKIKLNNIEPNGAEITIQFFN